MINVFFIISISIILAIYTTICYIDTKKFFENRVRKIINNLDDVVCELHNEHNISCESIRDTLRYCQVITIEIPLNKLDNFKSIITEQLLKNTHYKIIKSKEKGFKKKHDSNKK